MRTILVIAASVLGIVGFLGADSARGQDCTGEKYCSHCACKKRTRCCFHFESPPSAPIVGSAPAMMAPIVFMPPGASPSNALSHQNLDRDALRDLLAAIDALNPPAAPSSCRQSTPGKPNAPSAVPRPPADETVEMRLNRIDEQLSNLEKTVTKMDESAAKAIIKLNERLKLLEEKN